MPKRRVNTIIAIFLYAFAGVVDLIELMIDFIPVIGWIVVIVIDVVMALILSMIFLLLRVLNIRTIIAMFASLIWGAVPFVGSTSAWIMDVWYTLHRAKVEDNQKIAAWQAAQAGAAAEEAAEEERVNKINANIMNNEIRVKTA